MYTPLANAKREAPQVHPKRHGHQNLHKKLGDQKRGNMVTAVIDGVTQTWENNWFGPTEIPQQTSNTPAVQSIAQPVKLEPIPIPTLDNSIKQPTHNDGKDINKGHHIPAGDDFERIAYYNAASRAANGLVFLANKGDPTISGTWDT